MNLLLKAVKPVQEYFIEKFGEDAASAWGLNKKSSL